MLLILYVAHLFYSLLLVTLHGEQNNIEHTHLNTHLCCFSLWSYYLSYKQALHSL